MNRYAVRISMVIGLLCVVTPVLPASEEAAKAPAPAAAAAPVTQSVKGTLAELDLVSKTPHLTLTTTDGKSRSFSVEPKLMNIWGGGERLMLSQLKTGDHLLVKYVEKDGAEAIQSIRVQPMTAAAPSTGTSKTN